VFGPRDRYPLIANPGYLPAAAPHEDYVRLLQTLGCSRAVLVQPSPYGTDHSALLAAMQSRQIEWRGIALIDTATSDQQLAKLHDVGVQGIRLHFMPDNAETAQASLLRVADRIKAFGWHIQFYVDFARYPTVDRLLSGLPVPVVIDHFGLVSAADGVRSPGFQAMLRLAATGRAWFKLSAPYRVSTRPPGFPDVTPLAQALLAAAPDRCVWGTDWPHPNASFMPNDGDLVDLLADWIPDEALRHRVLVENPAQLYSF
jgi:predicted TIM-barrel fold metal-dependent hydrolase